MRAVSFISPAVALFLGITTVIAAPSDSQKPGFPKGQPYDGKGKGATILGKPFKS
jgi:hypothetical protein